MKSRITEKFTELKKKNEKALITYITAGDPDMETTFNLAGVMESAGADIIEIGIPYSDPLADGPVIQRASQRALRAGTTIDIVFDLITRLRKKTQIPLVFLVYFNAVYKYGFEPFLQNCSKSGIDGLIIPDLPLEERKELKEAMKAYAVDLIPLAAPTSEDRIKEIVQDAEGFVYCISSKGVTGSRDFFDADLSDFMNKVRKHTDIPLSLGFGISGREAVNNLKGICDGIIVGSAIIQKIEEGIQEGNIEEKVYQFVKELHEALILDIF